MGIGALSRKPYEIRGGGITLRWTEYFYREMRAVIGRLVFLGEIRTYLRGRTFACLHNSFIRDAGWENSQKLKNFSHSTFQPSCLDGPIYTWK